MSAMDKRVDRSRRDQIIVASGDFPLLATALDELGIHVRHPGRDDTIPELQLTKVELPALAADMVKIRENVYLTRYAESVADASRPRGTLPSEIDDLGLLMFRLRFDFAYRYAGAELVMGLNRYVHSTEAFGEIGGGGSGVPLTISGEIGGGGAGLPQVLLEKARDGKLIDAGNHTGDGVRIGVMDTKIASHAEFAHLLYPDFTDEQTDSDAGAMAGHGVFGAGLILQKAPGAKLVSVPVLDGEGQAEAWDVAATMMRFLDQEHAVDIVQMPFGAITQDGRQPLVLAAAARRLRQAGILLVAAAGNHGKSIDPRVLPHAPSYPGALPDVIAVGVAAPARISPDPVDAPWIKITRPGRRLLSTYLNNEYAVWGGSSFAAAAFVGEVAAAANGSLHTVVDERLKEWRKQLEKENGE
jgi:subtilisin family serine protease